MSEAAHVDDREPMDGTTPGQKRQHTPLPVDEEGRVLLPNYRQCTAPSRQSGRRCTRRAIPGGSVCTMHGGKTPSVQRAAQLRLLSLVEPAVTTLAREMATAQKSVDRQRAANSILDRAGIVRRIGVDTETARAALVERIMQYTEPDASGVANITSMEEDHQ